MSELKKERLQFKDLHKLILNIPRSKEIATNFCGQKELQKQTFEVLYTDLTVVFLVLGCICLPCVFLFGKGLRSEKTFANDTGECSDGYYFASKGRTETMGKIDRFFLLCCIW